MKNLILLLIVLACCLSGVEVIAQDTQEDQEQLNLPGDNLNLYAVMKLFQDSPTLEDFEKKLNDESAKVNNLDLNGDGQTDYIKVIDNVDGDTHNISLKVAVSKDEDQDVAVFVVHKDRGGQVEIQLIGDEDLYGKDYIIEPDSQAPLATPNPGYSGSTSPGYNQRTEAVNDMQVSAWPMITYIYVPSYSVWRSPWHWGYYPSYWRPWTPFFWHEYYGYQYHFNYYYRAHYRYTPVYRFPAWHDRYYGGGFRSRSNVVEVRVRAGNYRQTYTRPDLANRGADLFRRDHPQAPHVNRPLPKFDNNNNNRPIVTRPNRPGSRPGDGRPGNTDNSNNRPVTRPGNNTPGNGNNNPSRPVTRPINPSPDNQNGRPVRPVTRPISPTPGNGENIPGRPATRPVNPNPGSNMPNRPVNRPNPTPANGNIPAPSRPVTRPVITRPNATQPASTRPANNNFPSRPITLPAQPQPQQARQPANRPANTRPARDHHGNG